MAVVERTDSFSFSFFDTSEKASTCSAGNTIKSPDTKCDFKPYSLIHFYDSTFDDANVNLFLGENAPLKIAIVGFFHENNCPIEAALHKAALLSLDSKNLPMSERSFQSIHSNIARFAFRNHKIYEMCVQHGNISWIIFRRYSKIFSLYMSVKYLLNELCEEEERFHEDGDDNEVAKIADALPDLPKKSKYMAHYRHFKSRKNIVDRFLKVISNHSVVRNTPELLDFLEISSLSFIRDLGLKQKEGLVLMQCARRKSLPFGPFKKRWLIVKDTWVSYLKDRNRLGGVLLMDKNFKVVLENNVFRKNFFILTNGSTDYRVSCYSQFDKIQFLDDICRTLHSGAREFLNNPAHGSFAPVRPNVPIVWYSDHKSYFCALADTLEAATEEIFIINWFLMPLLPLKYESQSFHWRFDVLLKRKAYEGVNIFVLLSREFALCDYLKVVFKEFDNIKIMCYPGQIKRNSPIHHEKFVIVDQCAAFIGGMDSTINFGGSCILTCSNIDSLDTKDSSSDTGVSSDEISWGTENFEEKLNGDDLSAFDNACIIRNRSSFHRPSADSVILQGLIRNINKPDDNNTDDINNTSSLSYVYYLPFHDVTCAVHGGCARDVARHFIQRWNVAKLELHKNNPTIPLLLPKSYEKIDLLIKDANFLNCSVQVLRSINKRSSGMQDNEASIYSAILSGIQSAKHCIYIENHFFISATDDHHEVKNQVARELVNKIVHMHRKHHTFRVYVVLPLLPCLESGTLINASVVMRMLLHQQQQCISKGPNSLVHLLQNTLHHDCSEFISFCSLRDYDPDSLTTSQECIYSKLWIFDDREVIIGSANINDRSLLGDKDSELCLYVRDNFPFVSSRMRGRNYDAGRFAFSLRCKLMARHLGLNLNTDLGALVDPASELFYEKYWIMTAKMNSKIFEEVFGCCTSDDVMDFSELESRLRKVPLSRTNPSKARELLKQLSGTLVEFPLKFLSHEDLKPSNCNLKSLPSTVMLL